MKTGTTVIRLSTILVCLAASAQAQPRAVGGALAERFKQLDRNGDGKISREEGASLKFFDAADKSQDGLLTLEEVQVYFAAWRTARPAAEQPAQPKTTPPAAADNELVRKPDIRFAETPGVDAKLQSLDLYTTPSAKARPVFVFVHGGSWKQGDKAQAEVMAAPMVARGYVFASANYRLLPDAQFPANAEDVAAAVAWLHRHAAEFGGNAKRIFLAGHSAGAHLAALVGTDARFLAKHGLKLDTLSGVLALDTLMYDVVNYAQTPIGKQRSVEVFGEDPTVWRAASPALQAQPGTGLPPVAICYSGGMSGDNAESRKKEAERFAEALHHAGARATVIGAPEKMHGQIALEFAQPGDKVAEAVFAFFEGGRPSAATPATRQPHDSVLAPKKSAAAAKAEDGIRWQPSLTFDAEKTKEGPLPVNAMQLVTHRGMLFCGMATSFERDGYSGQSSYIYSKAGADAPWKLEADFGPGTSRIGQMFSARFVNDEHGKTITSGPQDVLVAFTMSLARGLREPGPLPMRVRDDATGRWQTVALPTPKVAGSNVRELWQHRDSVTGADLIFVAANPSPLGIYAGVYDPAAPGRIRWRSEPEITARGQRDAGKWFGMATVNGVLFASDADAVYRRDDGPQPKWTKVMQFPRVGDEGGAEVRGLTAVPNPKAVTGWPEDQMLILATQFKVWRMRSPAGADGKHEHSCELDLIPWLSERLGEPVVFAEAAFNRLTPFRPAPEAAPVWPIGFQVVYPVAGKKLSNRDPSSGLLKDDAWFLLRDESANYTLHRIESDCRLFLARDFKPSPFPGETHVLYAAGFNGSDFKGSLGTAWVYRGECGAKQAPQEPALETSAKTPAGAFTDLQFQRDFVPGTKDPRGNDLSGTELNVIVEHAGNLWAAMSYMPTRRQGDNQGALGPKILVKKSAASPWELDFNLGAQFVRAGTMKSVAFTTDRFGKRLPGSAPVLLVGDWMMLDRSGRGSGAERSVGVWSRNDATGRWTRQVLSTKEQAVAGGPKNTEVRLLFDHVDRVTGIHCVFAGASQGELFRGAYDPAVEGLIVWEKTPELTGRRHRFISAAEANGHIFVTVPIDDKDPDNGGLFERVDGHQPSWKRVGAWPLPNPIPQRATFACGLRGLSTAKAPDADHDVLLGAAEDYHTILRFDPKNDFRPERELDVCDYFTQLWGGEPRRPVIVAYNDMTAATEPGSGAPRHLIGVWITHPSGEGTELGNSSWYLVRSPGATYAHGRIFDPAHPLADARFGLRGCRSIVPSPFPEEKNRAWYFGGFDQTGKAWGNYAWIHKATLKEKR